MKIHTITFGLLIIGGLNWGLVALGYGIGSYLPGNVSMVIYVVIGLAALYEIFSHKGYCRNCNPKGGM